jgi:putative transposase
MEGASCSDRVRMRLSAAPKLAPSHVMKTLKGKSAERLREESPEHRKCYCAMHMWAPGCFVGTVGINSEIIKKYVREQQDSEIRAEQMRILRAKGD